MGLRVGAWMRFAIVLIKPALLLFTRTRWSGEDNVPEGGVILAANHISHVDPLTFCDWILFGLRRKPHFLAKSTLFKRRSLVGAVMRGAGQIPVHRGTADASLALREAVKALEEGKLVALYPEGTVSRDPDKWPMVARTGVARLALLSGAPVVPVAQWGAQEILDSYRSKGLHLLPPKRSTVRAFPPVDLSAYAGLELTAEVLRAATSDIMAALTAGVAELRGETPPPVAFDPDARRSVA